jgi:hypothetical protein
MKYLGAWGSVIHEKKRKSKISCQTPFNVPVPVFKCDSCTVLYTVFIRKKGYNVTPLLHHL